MKRERRKRILLLFAGGTSLATTDGEVLRVRTDKDVHRWMRGIPELSLIAAFEPFFLTAGMDAASQPQWWSTIAKTIAKRYNEFDGFLVTNDIDTIPYTSAALTLTLKGVGKPVVVTGALPLQSVRGKKQPAPKGKSWKPEKVIDIRANLINAAQVAILDLGEVAVVYGSKLLRGTSVIRQSGPASHLLESVGVPPIGRVDFGLKLEPHRRRRHTRRMVLATAMRTRILQLFVLPSSVGPVLPRIPEGALDGIFLSGQMLSSTPDSLGHILDAADARHVPVCFYSPWPIAHGKRFFSIHGVTPPMALVKFMWVLGQTKNRATRERLLTSDVAGEAIKLDQPFQ